MSRQDKALFVIVAAALAVAGAAWLNWRDQRFLEVAQSIDACDEEQAVARKTAVLGAPARDERQAESRVVSWRRNGRLLTVSFVTPPSRRLVVGSVRVAVDREPDPPAAVPAVVYEDTTGLRRCR